MRERLRQNLSPQRHTEDRGNLSFLMALSGPGLGF
jgi:hypothetical protein